MINKVFQSLIGDVIKAHIDDVVVKVLKQLIMYQIFSGCFDVAYLYRLIFNPENCFFGIFSGKFLGFMITQRCIEENLDKIWAILEMKALTNKKEAQRLIGRVAALNRFMSREADKCYHFFKAIED